MKRTEQREHIFKLLYGTEFHAPEELSGQISLYLEELPQASDKDREYIRKKTTDIAGRLQEADDMINAHTTGWKTSRMNRVDLTILRLAVYEMKWDDDVPQSVAIDEAVELAKKFSGGDSSSFVNGVLAKMADNQE